MSIVSASRASAVLSRNMYVGSFVWLLEAMKNRLTYARQPVEIKALAYTACDKFATYRIDTAVLKKNEVVSSAHPCLGITPAR